MTSGNHDDTRERVGLAEEVTDLAQTVLVALETAERLTDPAEAQRMKLIAGATLLNIVERVRRFAGLPPRVMRP